MIMINSDFSADIVDVEPVGSAAQQHRTSLLRAALARAAWADNPGLSAEYHAAHDQLFIYVGTQRTNSSMVSQVPDLFVGFDTVGRGSWPTTVAVGSARASLSTAATNVGVARQLLGDSFDDLAKRAMDAPDQEVAITLAPQEADRLRQLWDSLTTRIEATTAEELTDDRVAETLASWIAELTVPAIRGEVRTFGEEKPAEPSSHGRHTIPIDDESVFHALVGRARRRTEPWLAAEVNLDRKGSDMLVTVSITVPSESPRDTVISSTMTLGEQAWNITFEPDPAQETAITRKLVGCRLLPLTELPSLTGSGEGVDTVPVKLSIHVTRP